MEYISIYILVFVLFPIAFFYKAKIRKKEDIIKEVLNKNDTFCLKGLCAVAIMLSHYVMHGMDEANSFGGPIAAMKWAGGIGVCVFFFCSGYGLFLSTEDKEIEKAFLWKRFKRIFPAYWFLRLIFGLLLKRTQNGILYFILFVLGIKQPAWFVTEILLIYILFYISARISKKHIIPIMTAMLTVMSLLFFFMELEARWYNANLVFVLGMVFACHKSELLGWLNKNYFFKLIGNVFLFLLLLCVFIATKGMLFRDFIKLPAGGLVSIMLVQLLIKIKPESSFMFFIGKYSLELYLIHLNIWQIYSELDINQYVPVKFWSCVVVSLLCTWLYSLVDSMICRGMKKKKKA